AQTPPQPIPECIRLKYAITCIFHNRYADLKNPARFFVLISTHNNLTDSELAAYFMLPQTHILHFDGTRIEGISPLVTVDFASGKWRWTAHEHTFTKSTFHDGQGDATAFFDQLRKAINWGQKYFPKGGAIGFT